MVACFPVYRKGAYNLTSALATITGNSAQPPQTRIVRDYCTASHTTGSSADHIWIGITNRKRMKLAAIFSADLVLDVSRLAWHICVTRGGIMCRLIHSRDKSFHSILRSL